MPASLIAMRPRSFGGRSPPLSVARDFSTRTAHRADMAARCRGFQSSRSIGCGFPRQEQKSQSTSLLGQSSACPSYCFFSFGSCAGSLILGPPSLGIQQLWRQSPVPQLAVRRVQGHSGEFASSAQLLQHAVLKRLQRISGFSCCLLSLRWSLAVSQFACGS